MPSWLGLEEMGPGEGVGVLVPPWGALGREERGLTLSYLTQVSLAPKCYEGIGLPQGPVKRRSLVVHVPTQVVWERGDPLSLWLTAGGPADDWGVAGPGSNGISATAAAVNSGPIPVPEVLVLAARLVPGLDMRHSLPLQLEVQLTSNGQSFILS